MLFAATSILVGRSIISCQYLPSQLFIHVLKNGQIQAFFVYFCPFLITISIIQIEKRLDGVLGIQTWGRRMVGADETTELWRLP